MGLIAVLLAPMIPTALIWAFAFILFPRSRLKRVGLFFVAYALVGLWFGMWVIILGYIWLPATLVTLALFEWVQLRDSK